MEKNSSKNSGAVADDDDFYSSIEVNPDWSNFVTLVAVAEAESIKLEEEKKETKLRQNLSTFLKLLDEQEREDSIKNSNIDEKEREKSVKNSVAEFQIPGDQDSATTKEERSMKEKRSSPDTFLLKNFSQIPPLFELEDSKHQEEDSNCDDNGNILVSCGSTVKKSSKKSSKRCNKEKTDQDEILPRPKKIKMTNKYNAGPSTMPTAYIIPEEFKNRILELGGSEPSIIFVFQKILTKTDVNPHQGRLLIPFKQLKNEFLTDEENNCFQISKKHEINAVFIEPSRADCRINLRQWNMSKGCDKVTHNYSLVTHWNDVVRRNQLKEEMRVHLWAFRKGSQLGLALILVS